MINGAEAIGDDRAGMVTLPTFLQPVDEIYLASVEFSLNGIDAGDYNAVSVADDGCGMDDSIRAFTTKYVISEVRQRILCAKNAARKGGGSPEGLAPQGSAFETEFTKWRTKLWSHPHTIGAWKGKHLRIPAAASSRKPEPKQEPFTDELRGEGAILVIDDEEIVRKSAKSALEQYGYEVLQANDGLEGVRAFRKYKRKITAVLLDMMMPVMGGEEALRELRAISPSTPVIGSSGYSEALAMRYFGDKGLTGFLQKPYAAQALAECVKRAVEGRVRSHAG